MPAKKIPVFNLKNFNLPSYAQPDFYIKTLQEHQKEHPFLLKPHSHDFYLLMVFTKGRGIHTIDTEKYTIEPGSVFFMSPSEIHSWKLSADTDGFILFFNPSFYLMDLKANNLLDLPFYIPENKIKQGVLNRNELLSILPIIKTILLESINNSKNQKNILRSYLDILLFKFDGYFNTSKKRTLSQSSLIPKLESLIEQNFKEHLPLTYYADHLNISLPQLNATTNQLLNKSVNDLIHERIVLESKRFLVYSDLTIGQISDKLNYKDNSYFSRFFKKMTSQTPEQFRKKISTT